MRVFYNIKNGKFNSFFIEGQHNNIIFSEYENNEDGTIKSVLNENFIEIDIEKYKELTSKEGVIILENNNLTVKEIPPCNIKGVNIAFNQDKWLWEETATLEEQREYWLNKSLKISRKIEEYKMLGFEGRQELVDLENKLQEYKLKYASTFEGEALAMDKHMSSTKPAQEGAK